MHLYYQWSVDRHGVAQLPSPALLLDGRARGQRRGGERSSCASPSPPSAGSCRPSRTRSARSCSQRTGRRLVLTEAGRVVFRYADEIFSLGRRAAGHAQGRPTGRPIRFWSAWPTRFRSSSPTACSSRRSSCPSRCASSAARTSRSGCWPSWRARARPGALRRPDRPRRQGAGLQPPARRVRPSPSSAARPSPPRTEAASRARSTARRCSCRPRTRSLRRSLDQWFDAAGPPAPRSWASSRTAPCSRCSARPGVGLFPAPARDRGRGPGAVRGAARRPHRRGQGALLRHLRRAEAQAPGGGGDLGGGAPQALRLAGAGKGAAHGGERRAAARSGRWRRRPARRAPAQDLRTGR